MQTDTHVCACKMNETDLLDVRDNFTVDERSDEDESISSFSDVLRIPEQVTRQPSLPRHRKRFRLHSHFRNNSSHAHRNKQELKWLGYLSTSTYSSGECVFLVDANLPYLAINVACEKIEIADTDLCRPGTPYVFHVDEAHVHELAGLRNSVVDMYGNYFPASCVEGYDVCAKHSVTDIPGITMSLRSKFNNEKCSGLKACSTISIDAAVVQRQGTHSSRPKGKSSKLQDTFRNSNLLGGSSSVAARSSHSESGDSIREPNSVSLLRSDNQLVISSVTPLLHAQDFPKIIQIVSPLLKDLHGPSLVPLYFICGLSHFKLSNQNDARNSFIRCEEICVSLDKKGDVSLCNIYLGDIEFSSQHYLKAADHYKKATVDYFKENVASLFRMVPPALSIIYAKHGSALRNGSKMVDAVQAYKMAIDESKNDKDRLAAHTSLGNLYQSLGENSSALTHYQQSIELSEKLHDHISLGWAHGNLGNAFLGLFQKDKALYHLQKSLELTVKNEATPQAIGRTYNNLGTAFQSIGELDKAGEYYDLALSQAIYGNDIPGQARVYGNIGNVLMLRKKYSEAILHYSEVLHLSKDRSTLNTAHHNRGCAYYEWAETKMENLEKGVSTGSKTQDARFYIHGNDFKGIKYGRHHPRKVIASISELYYHGSCDLQEVVKYHEDNLDNIKGSSTGLTLSVSLFETNSRTFHRYQDCLVNQGEYTQALLVAEQSRARTLGELMLKRKGWTLPLQLTSPLSFDQIVTMVSSKTCPILYLSYTGARLLGWVFVPTNGEMKMNMFEVPLKDDQFDGKSFDYHLRYSLTEALVERSFEMYKGVIYDKESSEPVHNLYNLIAKPFLKILLNYPDTSNARKIMVISDSYTTLLPFSSLRDPETGSFLGDNFSFQIMPSLLTMGVLEQLPDTNIVQLPTGAHNLCIVGNPNIPQFFYNKDIWNMGKLPHAKNEAEWVAHILKTTPILEEQATKSAVLMRIMSAKVIHIATHGSATAGFLAFGAMVSVRDKEAVDAASVLLYPEDVEKLNINPALVVLSSCDSARGMVKADGIQGMARAFILAGAQAVLTTLWRVPDESAAIFMQFFYQYMVDGYESTLALQKAILSIRCFYKYSQYIHWSGYQLTGRDVQFHTSIPGSTHIIQQCLGLGTVFPRLEVIKALEIAIVNNPCYPTNVQILRGSPGLQPSEVAIDFIHAFYNHFRGGVYWISCGCIEIILASISYIEKSIGCGLDQLPTNETKPTLFVFDGMMELPDSEPLLHLMKNRHTHFVVLYTNYQPPDKLIQAIDHKLLRGSKVHTIDALSMIHSTQRMVYAIQREMNFAPNNSDQAILEKISDFTSGSPVLVDITSQALLACFRDRVVTGDETESKDLLKEGNRGSVLEEFAKSVSLDLTRQSREPLTGSFKTRKISVHVEDIFPSSTLTPEQRDVWDTTCQYDSWDSISELISTCHFEPEVELLLNCLAIFGCSPVPVTLVTSLSVLITQMSGNTHLASSLLHKLMEMKFIKVYPLPVIVHPSLKSPEDVQEYKFIYVPQYIADFLWKALTDHDKVFALTTSYRALSKLPKCQQHTYSIPGLTSLLEVAFELNFDLVGKECYQEVYKLYLTLNS